MNTVLKKSIEYDKDACAWRFRVVRLINANTRCTYEGHRLTRELARLVVKAIVRKERTAGY